MTNRLRNAFDCVAEWTARNLGSPVSFTLALFVVFVWAVSGPLFHFSDTWQLIINTGTTIVTFLMVFVIQNAQNRDAAAMQAKLEQARSVFDFGRHAEHLPHRCNAPFTVPEEQHHSSEPQVLAEQLEDGGQEPV